MKQVPILAAVAALLVAAPAGAATPVQVGEGINPTVTLDAAGTAYIAWIGEGNDPTPLFFCRLPRGAAACEVSKTIPVPGTSLSRPLVLVDGNTVRVISYRYGMSGPRFSAVYMFTSGDRGANFDAGVQIGTLAFDDAVRGPGDTLSMVSNNQGWFQRAPLAAGPVTTVAELSNSHPYTPAIELAGPNSLLATFANGSSQSVYRLWNGAGDPNDASTWTAPKAFADYAAYHRMANGPAGIFHLSNASSGHYVVRRWQGEPQGFGAPAAVPPPANPVSGGAGDMTQDPAGRLHVMWPQMDAKGTHVSYASSDDGTNWSKTTFDVADPNDLGQVAYGVRLAVAADHLGVAVWHTPRPGKVRALAIGPAAIPPPELGRTVTVAPLAGTVLVRAPGARTFARLTSAGSIPIGSTVDARKGTVGLTSAANAAGATQSAAFYDGMFKVAQKARAGASTDLLLQGSFARCPSGQRAATAASRTVRKLWGKGSGRFRTRGRYAAAAVRGTTWLVTDRCDATEVKVTEGSVRVEDLARRSTRTVKAPGSYTARPRR